jgi:hypothetical protein
MVVVAGVWEEGWFDNRTELNLWHFPLKDFGVDEFAMTPKSGMKTSKVSQFHSIEEMVNHYGLPVIVCTEDGDSDLKDFVHPENALYMFNRTSGGELPITPDHTLRIKTKLNKGMLWGHQAASIILYDRLNKWQ